MLPTKFQVNWPFSSRGEAKIDFQDGYHDLGFPIRTILAIFDLLVTLMLPIFPVNWNFGSGENAKQKMNGSLALAAILFIRVERFEQC